MADTDTRTALNGLYVAGEDAGGAHGSNRLGAMELRTQQFMEVLQVT